MTTYSVKDDNSRQSLATFNTREEAEYYKSALEETDKAQEVGNTSYVIVTNKTGKKSLK